MNHQPHPTNQTNQAIKRGKIIPVIGALLGLALAPGAFAQVNGDQNDNSMLYQPNVALTSLSQNQFSGIVGGQIITPYFYNVSVNYLGYADPTGAALTSSHTITIWGGPANWPGGGNYAANGAVIASATVAAGTPTLWANGYAWVQIPTVTLSFQSVYNVGATVVAGQDNWGNLLVNTDTSGNPDPYNNGQISWNVNPNGPSRTYGPFIQADNGSQYTAYNQGIYDFNTSDAGNPNPSFNIAGPDSIYSAVNLGYNLTFSPVPEPGTLSLAALGAALLLGFRLNRKAQKA